MKHVLPLLAALCISVSCFAQQPAVGTVVPDIKLPNSKGSDIVLSSLKGKVVILDFWASWCGPCRKAMPDLKALYKKYKGKGLEVYAVSLDDDKDNWKRAMFEDGTNWIQVIDLKSDVAKKWEIQYIPNTYLIDKDGKIVSVNANHAALEQQVDKLLN